MIKVCFSIWIFGPCWQLQALRHAICHYRCQTTTTETTLVAGVQNPHPPNKQKERLTIWVHIVRPFEFQTQQILPKQLLLIKNFSQQMEDYEHHIVDTNQVVISIYISFRNSVYYSLLWLVVVILLIHDYV